MKRIKELGHGMNGTTYLVEDKNGKQYAQKIFHILPKEVKKDYMSPIWREIDFFEAINRNFTTEEKKHFVTLHSYEIIDDCDHEQKHIYKILDPKFKKEFAEKDRSPYCAVFNMKYVTGTDLNKLLSTQSVTEKRLMNYFRQIIKIEEILKKHKYGHGDFWAANLMVTDDDRVVAIDYGSVLHKKYNLKPDRNSIRDFLNNPDIFYFIECSMLIIDSLIGSYRLMHIQKKRKKLLPGERQNGLTKPLVKIFKNHPEFYPLIREKYARQFPSAIADVDKVVKNAMDWKKISKQADPLMLSVIYRIDAEFAYFYPKEYQKYYQWCSPVKPLISFEKAQKILLANSFNQLKECF